MLQKLKNQKGFSLKELAMTLVVMGLLCGLAVVPYNMMQNARITTRLQAVLQNLETKLRVYKNDKGNFPQSLDDSPAGQVCQNCFATVLNHVPQQEKWFKMSATQYLFAASSSGIQENDFRKTKDFAIEYQPTTGQFTIQQNP